MQTPLALAWSNGGEAPVKTLAGASTGLNNPQGIAVAGSGTTFVVNYNASPQSMTAYDGDWTNGDTAPSKTLAGGATGIAEPQDVAIDSSGRTYIANLNGDVTVHAADWAAGNTAPIRSIPTRGANTGLIDPQGIHATDDGTIYVTQTLRDGSFPPTRFGQVLVFSPTASGDVAPIRTISGSNGPGNTGMGYATGVAVGPDGLIYVAADWDGVKVFAANADGDVAPVKSLSGSARRVAFDASGRLYVMDNNANEIRAYEAGFADGASPIKTLRGGSSGLSRLTDLAFDSSGRMYVALESPSSVRVFSTSYQTISFPAITDTTLAASPVTPSASASSSEAVTFTTTTPGVCTSGGANGASISLVGTGTCTVRASQGGNATWNPATPVDRSFVITGAPGGGSSGGGSTAAPAPAPAEPEAAPTPASDSAPAPAPVVPVEIPDPAAVSVEQFSAFTPGQIALIPPEVFQALPVDVVATLTPEQGAALTPAQVNTLRPAKARVLQPASVAALSPAQVTALRPAAVANLQAAAVAAMTGEQLQALRPAAVSRLTAQQLKTLSADQITALDRDQLRSMRPVQFKWLRPATVAALEPAQVRSLTRADVRRLRNAQIEALTPEQLSSMRLAQLRAMRNQQVQALSDEQVAALSPAQRCALGI